MADDTKNADDRKRSLRLAFPVAGLVKAYAYQSQPPMTTYDAVNVCPYDSIDGRQRGGSRPGLSRVNLGSSGGAFQALQSGAFVNANGIMSQLLLGISRGQIYRAIDSGLFTPVVGSSIAISLNATAPNLQVAQLGNRFYIANHRQAPVSGSGVLSVTGGSLTASTIADWTAEDVVVGRDKVFISGVSDETTQGYAIASVTAGAMVLTGWTSPSPPTINGTCRVVQNIVNNGQYCWIRLTTGDWPTWTTRTDITLTVGGTVAASPGIGNAWSLENTQTLYCSKALSTLPPPYPTAGTGVALTLDQQAISTTATVVNKAYCWVFHVDTAPTWATDSGATLTVDGTTMWTVGTNYWTYASVATADVMYSGTQTVVSPLTGYTWKTETLDGVPTVTFPTATTTNWATGRYQHIITGTSATGANVGLTYPIFPGPLKQMAFPEALPSWFWKLGRTTTGGSANVPDYTKFYTLTLTDGVTSYAVDPSEWTVPRIQDVNGMLVNMTAGYDKCLYAEIANAIPTGNYRWIIERRKDVSCRVLHNYRCEWQSSYVDQRSDWIYETDAGIVVGAVTIKTAGGGVNGWVTFSTSISGCNDKSNIADSPSHPQSGVKAVSLTRAQTSATCDVTLSGTDTSTYECSIINDDGAWPSWVTGEDIALTVGGVQVATAAMTNLWDVIASDTLHNTKAVSGDDPPHPAPGTAVAYTLVKAATPFPCQFQVFRPIIVYSPSQPDASSCSQLASTAGVVPLEPRLVCVYRDRLMLAGPGNTWYASRMGDPQDWDYGADPTDQTIAIAGTTYSGGRIGAPITALIPFGDDYLIFGCADSLWVLRGDPGAGGVIYNLSRNVGVVSADAWCTLPDNSILVLDRAGLYAIPLGAEDVPVVVSRERLPRELQNVDGAANRISMAYNAECNAVCIAIVPLTNAEGSHWWLDLTTKSLWPMEFSDTKQPVKFRNHRCNAGETHEMIVGCMDGVLRRFDVAVTTDDGALFDSRVAIGPIALGSGDRDGVIAKLSADMAESSSITRPARDGCAYFGLGANYLYRNSYSLDPLSLGDTSWEIGCWILCESQSGGTFIVSKWPGEYAITIVEITPGVRYWSFAITGSGGVGFLSPTSAFELGKWYFVRVYHRASALGGGLGVSVNGVLTTVAWTTGVQTSTTSPFAVSRYGAGTFHGMVDGLYVRSGILSKSQADWLYNDGCGRTYAEVPADIRYGLKAWWDMNETTGVRYDAHSGYELSVSGQVGREPRGIAHSEETVSLAAGNATWSVMSARTPESLAREDESEASGIWVPGNNVPVYPRVRGVSGAVVIEGSGRWGMEQVQMVLRDGGTPR